MNNISLLVEQIENSKRVLAMPAVVYPNGKSSHDTHRKQLLISTEKLEDAILANRFTLPL